MIRKLILLLTVASVCGLASGCGVLVVGGAATAASVVHDRRTAGTVVEDQAIEIKAYQALKSRSDRLANSHINATSYDNDVLLTGEVPSPEASRWAEETVASLDKVGKVYNELAVRPPSSLAERSNDAWITAKAKASLLGIKGLPGFDPTRVKVVTERGIVYLMGLVTTAEGNAAAEAVRQVRGVRKVVKVFEYLDEPPAAT